LAEMKIAFLPDLATNWQPLQQQLCEPWKDSQETAFDRQQ